MMIRNLLQRKAVKICLCIAMLLLGGRSGEAETIVNYPASPPGRFFTHFALHDRNFIIGMSNDFGRPIDVSLNHNSTGWSNYAQRLDAFGHDHIFTRLMPTQNFDWYNSWSRFVDMQTTFSFPYDTEIRVDKQGDWANTTPNIVEGFLVLSGQNITVRLSLNGATLSLLISVEGEVVVSLNELWPVDINSTPTRNDLTITPRGPITVQYVAPIVQSPQIFNVALFDPVTVVPGISGTWGVSTYRTIPPFGEITSITPPGFPNDLLSVSGTLFDRIGVNHTLHRVRDDHSIRTDGWYAFDTTSAIVERHVTVRTSQFPQLTTSFALGAVDRDGLNIHGLLYNPNILLGADGGESGWTNQPLDITLSPAGILGNFDSVLSVVGSPDTVVTSAAATKYAYAVQSLLQEGTRVSGVLTQVGAVHNELSSVINGLVKIDNTPPVPDVEHHGGMIFTDESFDILSGLSELHPPKIAFSASSGTQPADALFYTFDMIPVMPTGNYDIWVQATDKAGNVATERVISNLYIQFGEVLIIKDTDQGATLHEPTCPNASDITIASCTPDCTLGANTEIEENSPLTYKLTLTNTDTLDTATGTFTDYLPLGSIVTTTPTANPTSSASGLTFALETTGPYTGRYKVTGNYTLAPGAQVEIDILSQAPPFDKVTPTNNLIRNQATLDWTINSRNGSNDSNFALHELTERPSVDTIFTKVGADDLNTGLAGAEFALYRWNGANAPTQAEENQVVDQTILADGDWTRVTYDGEDATSTNDIFISAALPQGAVDLGALPTGIYTLIETKAPTGYALPIGQWVLTIDASKGDTGASDWKIEFAGKSSSIMPPAAVRDTGGAEPTYRIINARPFLIGMSGLSGTTGLLLAGFVIMVLVSNIYLVHRYKQGHKIKKQRKIETL